MDKLEEIENIRLDMQLSKQDFASELGISKEYYYMLGKKRPVSENLLNKAKHLNIDKTKQATIETSPPVPYYDVDFTSSFIEVINDQTTEPDQYVTHPFYDGCDFIVRNSGQSMAKLIKHGDAVGLTKISRWREFIPMGEVYAIVTKNGFRVIKIITKGENADQYTLVSKPFDAKKEEFPPQQIKKDLILQVYRVQVASHPF